MKAIAKSLIPAVAVATAGIASSTQAATITIACGAVGIERQLCESGAQSWANETGHDVQLISVPDASDQRYGFYRNQLSRRSKSIDIYQVDVIWPGLLAEHFIDLKNHIPAETRAAHLDSLIQTNTVNGRLVAMPWYTDVGLLYYRQDLLDEYGLEVPETWRELEEAARTIQKGERQERDVSTDAVDERRFWGYVFQGDDYEGLTCNALEWVNAHGGGYILDPETGEITINNEQARQALSRAGDWVGEIAPSRVTRYIEADSHEMFMRGNAAFMRNWPYAYELANDPERSAVAGDVGVTQLPRASAQAVGSDAAGRASVLGGWQLAVARYSENPEVAADLVAHLTSQEEQKRRAIKAGYMPTIEALYNDDAVLSAQPYFADMRGAVANAVPRPSQTAGLRYQEVSNAFWLAAHDVLTGRQSAEQALNRLESELQRLRQRPGGW